MSKGYGVLKELFIIRQIITVYYHTTPHPPLPYCRITERLVEICRKTNYLKAFLHTNITFLPSYSNTYRGFDKLYFLYSTLKKS